MKSSRFLKAILIVIGGISFALGIIGIFLPLLPTTPFLLLAAGCFAKSSPRFHHWLTTHPTFGPMISLWNEKGAIPVSAKIAAAVVISISLTTIWLRVPVLAVQIGVSVFLALVLTFIFTRPSR